MAPTLQTGFPVALINTVTGLTKTQSITVNSGTNRFLLVFTAHESAPGAVSGITYNSVALTKFDVIGATRWTHVEAWYLFAPDVGTFNVVATKATDPDVNHWGLGIYVFDNVDQTTPIRTSGKRAADTGTSSSLTLSSAASNDFLIDILSIDGTGHAAAVGADQTLGYSGDYGAGSNETNGSRQPVAGDKVMSWTWTTSAPQSHMALAIAEPAVSVDNTPKDCLPGMFDAGVNASMWF